LYFLFFKKRETYEDFYWYKIESLGIFSVLRFGEISKPPTNKDLVFMTVPFLLGYDDIYDDISAILSHAVRGVL